MIMPLPTDKEKRKYMFTDDIKFLQKAVVFHPNEKNKFLTVKLSKDHHWHPNKWDLPGGNVLFGILAEESLREEIREEAGLEVKSIRPFYVKTRMKDIVYYLFIAYTCTSINTEIVIGDEHTDYKWVTKEEFLTLEVPESLVEVINKL